MIVKEFRALLPMWAASAAAMVIAGSLGRDIAPLAVPIFFLGMAAIAAWPIGQEYSFRTLPALLTLPVPRSRIWLTKIAAAAPLLAGLSVVALFIFPVPTDWPFGVLAYFLPAVAALFIAPWLTMATRSTIAGIIFPNSIAAMLLIAGAWIGTKRYGATSTVDVFQFQFLWWTLGALTAIAAVHGWWMFQRLQAVEGRGAEIEFTRPRSAAAAAAGMTRQPAAWLIVKKELRLQQLAWIFAMLFAAGYVTLFFTKRATQHFDDIVVMIVLIHLIVQSLLTGSLAAAEERAFGTHDGQLLLPISATRQWMLKAGTAIAHALILSLALPAVLAILMPPEQMFSVSRMDAILSVRSALGSIALTSGALYVSTLSSSGVRALMVAIPVALGLVSFAQRASLRVSWIVVELLSRGNYQGSYPSLHVARSTADLIRGALLVALTWFILWRALRHYRWADQPAIRIGADAAWLALALFGYFAVSGLL